MTNFEQKRYTENSAGFKEAQEHLSGTKYSLGFSDWSQLPVIRDKPSNDAYIFVFEHDFFQDYNIDSFITLLSEEYSASIKLGLNRFNIKALLDTVKEAKVRLRKKKIKNILA